MAQLTRDTRQILEHVVELTYFMRGSIQYNDMMHMSIPERIAISEFISNHLEKELKKPAYAIY